MAARPTGTVTFLFTDIEESTRRWEEEPEEMRMALTAHDAVLRETIEANGGRLFKHTGDGVIVAFAPRRRPSKRRSWHNAGSNCQCAWAFAPGKSSCVVTTISARR